MSRTCRFLCITVACTVSVVSSSPLQAAVLKGDLAIIGYKVSGGDEVSFVALNDIGAGEQFYFADVGVDSVAVNDTEEVWRFNSTGISAGDVITMTANGTTWSLSAGGTVTSITTGVYSDGSSGANIGGSDDFIFFDSTDGALTYAASTHLFYLHTVGPVDEPSGLSDGDGVVNRDFAGATDHVRYNGSLVAGTAAELFAAISDVSNWENISPTTPGSTVDPDIVTNSGFTVNSAAVPEPGSFAFLGVLGGIGFFVKRRRDAKKASTDCDA